MRIITTLWLAAYMFAWWFVFVLPMRRDNSYRALAFIPAAIFALAVPICVADTLRRTPPKLFIIVWSVLPFLLIGIELIWRRRKGPREKAPTICR